MSVAALREREVRSKGPMLPSQIYENHAVVRQKWHAKYRDSSSIRTCLIQRDLWDDKNVLVFYIKAYRRLPFTFRALEPDSGLVVPPEFFGSSSHLYKCSVFYRGFRCCSCKILSL